MIRLLMWGLLLYIGYRILVSLVKGGHKSTGTGTAERPAGEPLHLDPVCGVYVSAETAVIGRHEGQRHYFCSMDCLEKYRERLDHSSPT